MRTISGSTRYEKDFKRERKGRHGKYLNDLLREAVSMLAADEKLPAKYRDHALTGEWKDFRDCHLKPDLVLIYRYPDPQTLELSRLGSHSELGL